MFEMQNIVAGYGPHVVLRGVDLTVPDEAVVALLGPNGAGKTTLLRTASGQLRPSSGVVRYNADDITELTPDERARRGICLIPEGRGVFPGLSVRDNLRLQAPPDGEAEAIPAAVRAFPRLGERLDQRAGTLSGGEQQMLALARVYTSAPSVILFDEVSMGLAPMIVDDIFEHIAALRHRSVSLVIVEQYVARALAIADYVYVLIKGTIEFAGEPTELGRDEILTSYLGEAS